MGTQNSDLDVRIRGIDELTPELNRLESKLIRFVGAIGAGMAAIRIGGAPINAAIELERELANVQKTTDFTASEMKRLSGELLTLSTVIDVSARDLAKIAAAAGQQGLGREGVDGVVKFTESVARMSSVLDITVEKAGDGIGKLVNIFKVPLNDIEKVISTFNEVSNNSTAKGNELLDVVRRIGDASNTLKLEQSVAIAATGLDFGQSPEVVGTAFSKMFSSMVQKQAEFTRLLKTNMGDAADGFGDRLRVDGVGALKEVLASLRTLKPADQQDTIIKLFGGGRIGALVNKLVNDTANTVLDRNLRNAAVGQDGLSAIKEQATVLNTVQAQATLTLNALTASGIKATEGLLGPLKSYLIELREGIKSPEFQAFINNLGRGLGEIIDLIAMVARGATSIGINWSNVLPVFKAFLALKLFDVMAGITSRLLGLGDAMKRMQGAGAAQALAATGAAATAAGSAVEASSRRFSAAWLSEKLGYQALYQEMVRQKQIRKELSDVQARQAAVSTGLPGFQAYARDNRTQAAGATNEAAAEAAALAARRQTMQNALQAEAAAVAGVQAQRNARLQVLAQEHAARVTAIEAVAIDRRSSTQRAARAAELAEEEARYIRSQRSVERYWAGRLATTQAGAQAVVQAERLAYFQQSQRVDASVAIAGNRAGDAAAATARVAAMEAERQALTNKAGALSLVSTAVATQTSILAKGQVLWAGMLSLWTAARSVLGTLLVAASRVGAVLLSFLGWAGVVYTLLDMIGVVDKLGGFFRVLGEQLGFVSKNKEVLAAQAEAATAAMAEERRKVLDLVKAYEDLTRNRTTGQVKDRIGEQLKTATTDPIQSQRDEAQRALLKDAASAIEATKVGATAVSDLLKRQSEEVRLNLEAATRNVDNFQKKVAERKKYLASTASPYSDPANDTTLKALEGALAREQSAYQKAQAAAEEFAKKQQSTSTFTAQAQQNVESYAAAVQKMFTPDSLALFDQFIVKLAEMDKQSALLQEAAARITAPEAKDSAEDKKRKEDQFAQLQASIQEILAQRAALQEEFNKSLVKMAAAANNETERAAILALTILRQKTPAEIETISLLTRNPVKGNLDGSAAPTPAPASTGDTAFSTKGVKTESMERRFRRAQLEAMTAQARAVAALAEELNNQKLAQEQDHYDQGLSTIKAYYEERLRIQLASNRADLKAAEDRLIAIDFEAAKPGVDKAEAEKYRAQRIAVLGEIDIIEAKRKGLTEAQIRELGKAYRDFNAEVKGQFAELSAEGFIPSDMQSVFEDKLDALVAAAKPRLDKLRSEGRYAVADALEASSGLEALKVSLDFGGKQIDVLRGKLSSLKDSLAQQVGNGTLSAADAERAYTDAVRETQQEVLKLIEAQQQVLANVDNPILKASPGYAALKQNLENARLQTKALGQEMDTTARSINSSLQSTLEGILANLRPTFNSLKEALGKFVSAIGQQVLQTAAKSSAEYIMKSVLGSGGAGGIGGAISKVFGFSGEPTPGSSPLTPMYTAPASAGLVVAQQGVAATESVAKGVQGMWDGVVGTLQKSDNVFMSTIGNVLSFLSTAIGGLVSAIFATGAATVSAVIGAGATDAGAGILGDVISLGANLAHTGGIVGNTSTSTRVHPAAFMGALRYHTGGIVGDRERLGLRPGEVPLIGKEGEEMLTEDDPRHRNNIGKNSASKGIVNVWVVTPDQKSGIGPSDIVAVVSDDIARGGSIRRLVKSVAMGQ